MSGQTVMCRADRRKGRTPCRYALFGKEYWTGSLVAAVRHAVRELHRRDAGGLRQCVGSVEWLGIGSVPKHIRGQYCELEADLWADVRWVNSVNLKDRLRDLLRRMGFGGWEFVIRGFGYPDPDNLDPEEFSNWPRLPPWDTRDPDPMSSTY